MRPDIKNKILNLPAIGYLISAILRLRFRMTHKTSANYWESRYRAGGTSGEGSYNRLAEFKAEVLNDFVEKNNIRSVIEFGCGDGNQLSLARYPSYRGLDVSPKALELCRKKFAGDPSKQFVLYQPFSFQQGQLPPADLALSLDVIFHLIEDRTYESYMQHLFKSSKKYVVIYSTNFENTRNAAHQRDRKFSTWVEQNCPKWRLIRKVENRYPTAQGGGVTSDAVFHIYLKESPWRAP